jgi:hypothetical protein
MDALKQQRGQNFIYIEMLNGTREKAYISEPLLVKVGDVEVTQQFYFTKVEGSDAVLGMDWMQSARAGIEPESFAVVFKARKTLVEDNDEADVQQIKEVDADVEFTLQVVPGWNFDDIGCQCDDAEIEKILKTHGKIFATSYDSLGTYNLRKHQIRTENCVPIFVPPRRRSAKEREDIASEVAKMLEAGVIRKSQSPWGFPIILAPKPDGSKRFCVDFRLLNKATLADKYPVARVDDVIDRLQGARIFSTLDLKCGYWQIELDDESIPKTAFSTPDGHFEFVRMPFGLKNAPADFSRIMREVFGGLSFVETYLDDITIFSSTPEEHLEHLEKVFTLLEQYNLRLNGKKCHFGQTKVKVLGFIVGEGSVSQDPEKTTAIVDRAPPSNVRELRSFLGLSGYYRRFIKDYAKICVSFYGMLKKEAPFNWTEECQAAFVELKKRLTEQPVLALPDLSRDFILHTDASGLAIGAVLAQKYEDGEHVIAYASKLLKNAQINYGITEKECLAVVWSVNFFRVYLHGPKFEVVTDHSALKWLLDQKEATGRLGRWILSLQDFDYTIRFRKGSEHVNADVLSRPPISRAVHEVTDRYEPWTDVHLLQFLETGVLPSGCSNKQVNRVKRNALLYSLENGVLKKRVDENLMVVPKVEERKDLIWNTHLLGHFAKMSVVESLKGRSLWWPRMIDDVEKTISKCRTCARFNGMIPLEHEAKSIQVSGIFERIGIDLITNLPVTREGFNGILVITEYFSKFPYAVPVCSKSAEEIAGHLWYYMSIFGCPKVILSDQGTEFLNKVVEKLTRAFGVVHRVTSSYNPRTNGLTERFNKTLVQMLAKMTEEDPNAWNLWIPYCLMAYRSRVNSTTGFTPFELLFGVKMNLFDAATELQGKFDLEARAKEIKKLVENDRSSAQDKVEIAKTKQRNQQDKRGNIVDKLDVGQQVFVKIPIRVNKLQRKFSGPFIISRVTDLGNYFLKTADGKELPKSFPVTKLKLFAEEEKNEEEFFEIENILDHRMIGDKIEYFVKWAGYPDSDNSWVQEEHFNDPESLREYWEKKVEVNEDVDA